MGAVVVTYNLPGVSKALKLTPDVVADLFLGKITKWNDARIAKLNPGVKLEGDVLVVHRSDGSGTTNIFSDYLSKVSPAWKEKVGTGTALNWPVGLGGKGNEGVAGLLKQMPSSIGYVELIYAIQNRIPYGTVQNAAGNFVKADLTSVTQAAAGAAKSMPVDFRVSITNSPGADAYPVSSFTWLLIPEKPANPRKGAILVGFLKWMLSDGQKMVEALSYAPLPKEVVTQELAAITQIQAPGAK